MNQIKLKQLSLLSYGNMYIVHRKYTYETHFLQFMFKNEKYFIAKFFLSFWFQCDAPKKNMFPLYAEVPTSTF